MLTLTYKHTNKKGAGIMTDTSIKLKELMQRRNIKSRELSAMTGISESSISQYLSGRCKPKHDAIMKITKALGADPRYFTEYEDIEVYNPYTSHEELMISLYRLADDDTKLKIDALLAECLKKF